MTATVHFLLSTVEVILVGAAAGLVAGWILDFNAERRRRRERQEKENQQVAPIRETVLHYYAPMWHRADPFIEKDPNADPEIQILRHWYSALKEDLMHLLNYQGSHIREEWKAGIRNVFQKSTTMDEHVPYDEQLPCKESTGLLYGWFLELDWLGITQGDLDATLENDA